MATWEVIGGGVLGGPALTAGARTLAICSRHRRALPGHGRGGRRARRRVLRVRDELAPAAVSLQWVQLYSRTPHRSTMRSTNDGPRSCGHEGLPGFVWGSSSRSGLILCKPTVRR